MTHESSNLKSRPFTALVRDGSDPDAASAAEGLVGSVVEAEAVLLLRR